MFHFESTFKATLVSSAPWLPTVTVNDRLNSVTIFKTEVDSLPLELSSLSSVGQDDIHPYIFKQTEIYNI